MRHYEIALIIHPDQGEQVPAMIERYSEVIAESGGKIHRVEDWKRIQLAYLIEGVHKAHYIILNIEAEPAVVDKLTASFRFNDAVLRNMVIVRNSAHTDVSSMMKKVEQEESAKTSRASAAQASKSEEVTKTKTTANEVKEQA